ncbi:MAG: hypothetical protein HUJ80_03235, partial [Firmicutes bacterium]|nr:hypothetical protein [Bacillota bacterium]
PSTCPRTGFISYYIDGMEQEFLPEPEELRQLDASQLAGLQIASFDMQKKNCSAGDPLYKLVSSDIWYMALVCDSRCKDLYSEGQTITVCFAENAVQRAQEASGASNADTPGEKEASSAESSEQQNTAQFSLLSEDEGLVKIPATVLSCEENNGYLLVIASTRRYYEDFVRLRTTDVNVITSSCEGLLIPRTAVTQQEGVFGVYQKLNNGEYSFLPVNIIGENDSDYVITPTSFERTGSDGSKETVTTVKVYDEILRNAEDTRK